MPKRKTLTRVQKETLSVLKEYFDTHGEPPTLKELSDILNLGLPSVSDRIEALRKKGVIRKIPHQKRNIEIVELLGESTFVQVPVVASVGADNMDIFAQQEFDNFLQIDRKILDGHRDVFAVKVMGQSMRDAGIEDGSFVIAESIEPSEAKDGDRVVVVIEDKAVVKRLKIADKTVAFMPENKEGDYQPVIVRSDREDYNIVGRVIDVLPFSEDSGNEWDIVPIVES